LFVFFLLSYHFFTHFSNAPSASRTIKCMFLVGVPKRLYRTFDLIRQEYLLATLLCHTLAVSLFVMVGVAPAAAAGVTVMLLLLLLLLLLW